VGTLLQVGYISLDHLRVDGGRFYGAALVGLKVIPELAQVIPIGRNRVLRIALFDGQSA
jgi:hypothetical protein